MNTKTFIVTIVLAMLIATQPAAAQVSSVPAIYDHPLYTDLPFQAWHSVTFDGTKDLIDDGVTTYANGQFTTPAGVFVHLSGRCILYNPASFFAARLSVTYSGNLYPVTIPVAFTNDRTVTLDYTFNSGQAFSLQLYYDNGTVPNSYRCNLLIEAV